MLHDSLANIIQFVRQLINNNGAKGIRMMDDIQAQIVISRSFGLQWFCPRRSGGLDRRRRLRRESIISVRISSGIHCRRRGRERRIVEGRSSHRVTHRLVDRARKREGRVRIRGVWKGCWILSVKWSGISVIPSRKRVRGENRRSRSHRGLCRSRDGRHRQRSSLFGVKNICRERQRTRSAQ